MYSGRPQRGHVKSEIVEPEEKGRAKTCPQHGGLQVAVSSRNDRNISSGWGQIRRHASSRVLQEHAYGNLLG